MQWACLWRGTFTYASDCSLTARVPTYVQKEKTLKKNISSKLALRLGWRHTVDCLEDDLRCFGIGGRVPPIYVRCLFPFKLPYFRYMGILGSRHLFPEVIKWNQWEAAFFFAAKFQWMWTATQLRKNMPEFKKLSPVSELLQKKIKKGSGSIRHSGVVEICCWKKCSGCGTRPGGHTGFPEWILLRFLGILKFWYPPNTILFYDFDVVGGRYASMWLASHASHTHIFTKDHLY